MQMMMVEGEIITAGMDGFVRSWNYELVDMLETDEQSGLVEIEPMNEVLIGLGAHLYYLTQPPVVSVVVVVRYCIHPPAPIGRTRRHPLSGDSLISAKILNPFTAPACKMSGLKDARTRQQTVYLFSCTITHLLSVLCVLIKLPSHASAK